MDYVFRTGVGVTARETAPDAVLAYDAEGRIGVIPPFLRGTRSVPRSAILLALAWGAFEAPPVHYGSQALSGRGSAKRKAEIRVWPVRLAEQPKHPGNQENQ